MTQEDPSIRLKRLRYRASHRGLKEADLILGPFAEQHLSGLSAPELDAFERLLDVPDQQIYDWVAGRAQPPKELGEDMLGVVHTIRLSSRRTWTS